MPVYSYSRINTFENCPLQFKFRYVDKIKRYRESVEAFLGSRCHDVFEKLYKDKKLGKNNSLEDLLSFYNSIWDKKWRDDIQIVKKEYKAEHYKNIGQKAIKDYYAKYHPFEQSKTINLEKAVYVTLNGNGGQNYKFMGYIDRLSEVADGELEVHDYKTSGTLPEQRILDQDKQLALYQIAVENSWPNSKKVHLVWHYLVFDKEMRSYRTAEQLEKLKQVFLASIKTIEQTTEANNFLPLESPLCNWCDYPDLCPKRRHLFSVKDLPQNEYLKEDGVKLVNKYAELVNDFKEKKRIHEEEKAKIEAALIEYAKKKDLEKVIGTEFEANIKKEKKGAFPRTNEPTRIKLDEFIKEIGIWDKVSSLSSAKLLKSLQSNGLTNEQIKKINEFQTVEEKTSVSLSKLKDQQ